MLDSRISIVLLLALDSEEARILYKYCEEEIATPFFTRCNAWNKKSVSSARLRDSLNLNPNMLFEE